MKKFIQRRRKTRKLILQAIYSWEISKNEISEIKTFLLKMINVNKIDIDFFNKIINNIIEKIKIIDSIINKVSIKNNLIINPIDLTIIRISLFELLYTNIPYKIIISEALILANSFSSKKSYAFINKFLDNTRKNIAKNYNFSLEDKLIL